MTWTLHPKVLDAHVERLETLALHEDLRNWAVVRLAHGHLDVHSSAFARAYHVEASDGRNACLRIWSGEPDSSLLTTYSALSVTPDVCMRSGLPRVRLFEQAFKVDGKDIPAVLMDWVHGDALGESITTNAMNRKTLGLIAEALLRTFVMQNAVGTSHGDLRASNVKAQMNTYSVGVRLIDLDSVRWSGGPALSRVVGGNPQWNDIRRRDRVSPLQYDYLDQALTYLAVMAVSQDPKRWPGATDGFLTLDYLRADVTETLCGLENLRGTPGRLAATVRLVMRETGHWEELSSAMSDVASAPLGEQAFWTAVFDRTSLDPVVSTSNDEPGPTHSDVSLLRKHWVLLVVVVLILAALAGYWFIEPAVAVPPN